ncbi:MAG: hypothetical protein HC921_07055 [Synechococcaceae cyanobacterium SM2_3_1]|nr:hypothetical protein [Synechococcaceae cyanobacterium SM2_3_1]
MLVTLEKALEIIGQGKHVMIMTTDGKIALVPSGKADMKVSSMEAINLMFYVVRMGSGDDVQPVWAQLEQAIQEAAEQANKPDPATLRQQRYREIRGIG